MYRRVKRFSRSKTGRRLYTAARVASVVAPVGLARWQIASNLSRNALAVSMRAPYVAVSRRKHLNSMIRTFDKSRLKSRSSKFRFRSDKSWRK